MKQETIAILVIGLALSLSACGPSQAELDATATQVAADIFATQTALAPTITPTFTPTPTFIPSPTPTITPSPTRTRTITPTTVPPLMAAVLTLGDLPDGFSSMPEQDLAEMSESLPEDATVFAFTDDEGAQMIMGVLMSYGSRQEQIAFDQMLPSMLDMLTSPIGGDAPLEPLTGLDDIGESREGVTFLADTQGESMHWDVMVFRRGEVAEILYYMYPEQDEPVMPFHEIARLLDERLKMLQEASF